MAVFICNESHPTSGACTDRTESYTGAVLATVEENWHDDSDFIAIVWDADAGAVKTVCYASTRSWTYHNGARVDATDEVRAAAISAGAKALAAKRATVVDIGVTVASTTTRGNNVGIVGEVRWMGESKYGRVARKRVGVKVEGEDTLRYLDADRVQVLNTAERMAALQGRAAQDLILGRWSLLAA